MHPVERELLIGVGDASDFVQFGGAMLVAQGSKHSAPLYAGELPIIAHEDQLGLGLTSPFGQFGEMFSREHGRFIDD